MLLELTVARPNYGATDNNQVTQTTTTSSGYKFGKKVCVGVSLALTVAAVACVVLFGGRPCTTGETMLGTPGDPSRCFCQPSNSTSPLCEDRFHLFN